MIRTRQWKLIHYLQLDRYQLFNLKDDPDEIRDLSNDKRSQAVMKDLIAKLKLWQKEVNDPVLDAN